MIIIWSPLAEFTYNEILLDILNKWSVVEMEKFNELVKNWLNDIKEFKQMCPASTKNSHYRKCVISKQTSLIYRIVDQNRIELLEFIVNKDDHQHY